MNMKKIMILALLSFLVTCKPSSSNTESANSNSKDQSTENCIDFKENEFASSLGGSNQYCLTNDPSDIDCEFNTLILQSDGNGSYEYGNHEGQIPLKWKKKKIRSLL